VNGQAVKCLTVRIEIRADSIPPRVAVRFASIATRKAMVKCSVWGLTVSEDPPSVSVDEINIAPAVPAEAVRSELKHILESPEFRASKRCQDFLTYIVEQALAGLPHGLKEHTIGVEAFGRPLSYDTNADGIVRIKASEVRKRLALYYAGSGRESEIVVSLPVGCYIPAFSRMPSQKRSSNVSSLSGGMHPVAVLGTCIDEQISHEQTSQDARRVPRHWTRIVGYSALAILVAILSAWWELRRPRSVLDEFWQPVIDSASPILVATAYAPVYLPPPNAEPRNGAFRLLSDQYVGGGDLVAAVQVSGMLARMGRPYTVRMGTAVALDDLRNTPTVLIGYSSTQWAEITKSFRFFIDDDDLGMVRDNGEPTEWYPHNRTADYHTNEDYAVITRAFLPQTRSMLILITGCTQYGTEGAARLITNSELLANALHGAPKGWQEKNFQLVLRMEVIANSPASAQVIASYYW